MYKKSKKYTNNYHLPILLIFIFLLLTGYFNCAIADIAKPSATPEQRTPSSQVNSNFNLVTMSESMQDRKPDTILFGIYPTYIHDLNLQKGIYTIGFYAWWRTKNKDYNPNKSIEIVNASNYYSKGGLWQKIGDEYVTDTRYYATMYLNWNIKYFPFDRQFLDVKLEDFADVSDVIFEPDTKQSRIHSELDLKGWSIENFHIKNSVTRYDTNFGNITTKQGLYSRLTFIIEIKRHGWRPYFDYFIGFFIAAFLCFMVYLVEPGSAGMSIRSSLALGAVFSFVGNKYILNQSLPFTTEFTLNDAIQLATIILIFITILHYITLDVSKNDKAIAKAKKYNYTFASLLALTYIGYIGFSTYRAIIS